METQYSLHPEVEKHLLENFWDAIEAYKGSLPEYRSPENLDHRNRVNERYDFYKAFELQHPKTCEHFKKITDDILSWRKAFWSIQRPDDTPMTQASPDAVMLFTGMITSQIITNPDELWTLWDKQGFHHPLDFVASLGVLLKNTKDPTPSDQKYIMRRPDNSRIQTVIGGNFHGDFVITQTDITPYITLSPYEYYSSVRPIIEETDVVHFWARNGTECAFLSILLKYAEQVGQYQEVLLELDKTIQKYQAMEQKMGNFGESWHKRNIADIFIGHDYPISRKWELSEIYHSIKAWNQDRQQAFIDDDKALVFVRMGFDDELLPWREARFYPYELPSLINILFASARNGDGRSSVQNFVNMVEYYRGLVG